MAKPIAHYEKWRIRWLDAQGKRRSEVYDRYRDAEKALDARRASSEASRRSGDVTPPISKTFNQLFDYYLANITVEKRRQRDDQGIVRNHLRPAFGHIRLTDFNTEHLDVFKASRRHLHKKTMHHILTLLISTLRAANDRGWIGAFPKVKKPKLSMNDKDFHFLRTDEEIRRFLDSAQDEGTNVHALFACAVFTGMRQGELAGLRWDDVDFTKRLITVQRSFDGPTKNGEVRYVPILDALLPTLRDWRLSCLGQIVFPSEAGTIQQPSGRIFQEVFWRVLDHALFSKIERDKKMRRYITFHSLRHTFASHWMMKGGDIFRLQRILGHKSIQMTQRYSHLAPDAFSSDYNLFGVAPISPAAKVFSITSKLSCN